MDFHNSIPIPYRASLNLDAINAHACIGLVLSKIWLKNWYLSNKIWCKSLVADIDCVAILCSVLCSDLVEHIESISTILC